MSTSLSAKGKFLLGPNGAGKTTLISIICGIVNPSAGQVLADGYDIVKDYRQARQQIGLVPQELAVNIFETVWSTVSFSRGLFGKAPNRPYLEQLLKDLSLWDKKDSKIMARRHEASGVDCQGTANLKSCFSTSPPPESMWSCVGICGR